MVLHSFQIILLPQTLACLSYFFWNNLFWCYDLKQACANYGLWARYGTLGFCNAACQTLVHRSVSYSEDHFKFVWEQPFSVTSTVCVCCCLWTKDGQFNWIGRCRKKKGGDKHLRNLVREEDSFTIQIINKALEVVQPEPNPVFLTQPSW